MRYQELSVVSHKQVHQCAASKVVSAMSSGRYLNLRGRGSSFDRSRLARRMANLDTPALPTAEQGVVAFLSHQSLHENVSAIVTTCNKLQINRLILHCLPHIGHPSCKVFRLCAVVVSIEDSLYRRYSNKVVAIDSPRVSRIPRKCTASFTASLKA